MTESIENDPLFHFSRGYDQARSRFRKSAESLKAIWPGTETWAYSVPSSTEPDLTVDYAYLPARKEQNRILVMTSGVHGIEGFTGSAIQLMVMNELVSRFSDESTGLLIVHCLNPYGFKHGRRATENNVNLNRNFSTDPSLYQRTKNPAYVALRNVLEPEGVVLSPTLTFASTLARLGSKLVNRSMTAAELIQGIAQGQYEFPRGLEFGGHRAEPQIEDFLKTLGRVAKPYDNVVLLDLHTGLGENRRLHLISVERKETLDEKLFTSLFEPANDASLYAFTPQDSEGFYSTSGDLNSAVPDVLSPGTRALALTIEFGTLGNRHVDKVRTLNRLILENQGYHYGYWARRIEERVHQEYADLFFPRDNEWRKNVIEVSRELLKRVFERMKRLDRHDSISRARP